MPPVDVAGCPVAPDLGRESMACSIACDAGGASDCESGPWPAIGAAQWRSLKRSIVEAGAAGAISAETAHRMINRFGLREI